MALILIATWSSFWIDFVNTAHPDPFLSSASAIWAYPLTSKTGALMAKNSCILAILLATPAMRSWQSS